MHSHLGWLEAVGYIRLPEQHGQGSRVDMASEPAQDNLLRLLDQLSLGDLSILELALQKPGAGLTTMPGSANDNLWREFVTLGWMTRQERVLSPTISILLYEMTPLGEPAIRQLFAEFVRRRSSAAD